MIVKKIKDFFLSSNRLKLFLGIKKEKQSVSHVVFPSAKSPSTLF